MEEYGGEGREITKNKFFSFLGISNCVGGNTRLCGTISEQFKMLQYSGSQTLVSIRITRGTW